MATEIRVPTLGESVTEATVGQWFKKVGDAVAADEPLVELETDKVTLEVPAPAAGVIEAIAAKDGETVGVGALLGSINAEAPPRQLPRRPRRRPTGKPDESRRPKPIAAGPEGQAARPGGAGGGSRRSGAQASGRRGASPAARKIMSERSVQPAQMSPAPARTAASPRPTRCRAPRPPFAAPRAAGPGARAVAADDAAREERVRMTRLRQTIARRLKEAQNTAAMLTTFNEVDMSAVMALRTDYRDLFEKKHGVKLGFMGFFVKACVQALKEIPAVNAEIDGTDLVYKNYYHIGVAVGTDRGLVVPVVRDADRKSLAEIEKTIADLGKRARDGQLKIEEMQGGTFTITNGGIYGSLMSTPILNAPQSGILGMHKIQERPVVVAGKIEVRPMMYLALSYDHRIVDGREAVTFLVRVKESLEDPQRLVLDL